MTGPEAPLRTRPAFDGDDWSELRDAQAAVMRQDIAVIGGTCMQAYHLAARITDIKNDVIHQQISGDIALDHRALGVAQAHLAAHWRLIHGHTCPRLPEVIPYDQEIRDWQSWLDREVRRWFHGAPQLVRLVCRAMAFQNTHTGILAEMDLWDALKEVYPLTPPRQGDFWDDPQSYLPR